MMTVLPNKLCSGNCRATKNRVTTDYLEKRSGIRNRDSRILVSWRTMEAGLKRELD